MREQTPQQSGDLRRSKIQGDLRRSKGDLRSKDIAIRIMSSSSSNSNRRVKMEKEREKQVQDRLQVLICEMLKDEDNKYCVDCDSKGLSNDSGLVKSYF